MSRTAPNRSPRTQAILTSYPLPGLLAAALLLGAGGCDDSTGPTGSQRSVEFDFTTESHGWVADFSDFGVDQEGSMDLDAGHRMLPDGLEIDGMGLFVGATNVSDDVFMYWTGHYDGLEPDTQYRIDFEVEFATDSPSGCAGIGGAPGESVHLKVSATDARPEPFVEDDFVRLNIDKGNQLEGGADAIRIGHVGNTASGCDDPVWELKTVASAEPFTATTDDEGGLWFLVGTDSGFEGRTELYYTRYRATLRSY